jgi:hypothetical protein
MIVRVKAKLVISYGYATNYRGLELKYKVKTGKWGFYKSDMIALKHSYNVREDFEDSALRVLSNLTIEELQDMIKKNIKLKVEANRTNNEKLNRLMASKNKELDFEFTFKA